MRSLRARVALAAVAAAALVVITASAVLIATAGRDDRRDLDHQLERRAEAVGRPPFLRQSLVPGDDNLSVLPGGDELVRISRPGGPTQEFGAEPSDGELPIQTEPGFRTFDVGGEQWRSFVPVPAPPPAPPPGLPLERPLVGEFRPEHRVQVAASLEPIEKRVDRRRRLVVVLGLAGLAVAGALGFVFGGLALRPLGRLRAAAARVGETRDLSSRVPVEGPEEVGALAESLNGMLARLQDQAARTEAALEASRRFAADAGHELRTPLTSIAANLEAVVRNPDLDEEERRRALDGVRREMARFGGVLDALQDLARGDAGVGPPPEKLDLAELAEAAVASARSRHPELEAAVRGDGPLPLVGSAAGLRLILDNLLENAAVHGGRRVEVGVARNGRDRVRVTVDDDGPGVPEGDRTRVFGRFERGGAASGSGSGLGLAIVEQQAARHGGGVRIEDGPLGGARFVVDLDESPSYGGGTGG